MWGHTVCSYDVTQVIDIYDITEEEAFRLCARAAKEDSGEGPFDFHAGIEVAAEGLGIELVLLPEYEEDA